MLQKLREDRGPARSTLHTPDCEEAPHGAPVRAIRNAGTWISARGASFVYHSTGTPVSA